MSHFPFLYASDDNCVPAVLIRRANAEEPMTLGEWHILLMYCPNSYMPIAPWTAWLEYDGLILPTTIIQLDKKRQKKIPYLHKEEDRWVAESHPSKDHGHKGQAPTIVA